MGAADEKTMGSGKIKQPRKKLADLFLQQYAMDGAGRDDYGKIIDDIIKHALLQRATDIHIERSENGTEVRFRIDGVLHEAMRFDAKAGAEIALMIKHLAYIDTGKSGAVQEGRIPFEGDVTGMRMHVSIFPYLSGEKIVMRAVHSFAKGMTLEKLGMHDEVLEKVHRQIRKPRGVILIVGPVGGGATTTAYTLMDILSGPSKSIGTIEDPIEHRMPRIHQMQVDPKMGITFSNSLDALLKQDNDILMVGEIRDSQTLQGVIRASSWGEIVISTLHAKSAFDALEIIRGMENEPFEIGANVNCIISQRLVRRLCSNCAVPYALDEKQSKKLPAVFDVGQLKGKVFYKTGKGCDKCGSTGYTGRIGIFEILEIDNVIARQIFQQASIADISAIAQEHGMRTLGEDILSKALLGLVSLEEAVRGLIDEDTL